MNMSEQIAQLYEEGRLLAAAAEEAGTDAPVPTCPGWRVRDLLRHTGTVHRWATAFVVEAHSEYVAAEDEPDLDGMELIGWFNDGLQALVTALEAAPSDLACWTFMPAASGSGFWARRQMHETTVHRVDAESALGTPHSRVDTARALDGIDELLVGFHARTKSRVRTEDPRVLRVHAVDANAAWTVRLSDGPPRAVRDDGRTAGADCVLSGSAEDLYLALWNRLPLSSVTVGGDEAVARLWTENSAVV
ncbi:maleylpyruvate isomerase family mycothiol-dependent enzyme [Streptomyces sp. NBC_00102]|uniref:maleylpyruvate isomerase family mycothiol-dependent enzyme n=1 Tax=Streptomyces sp. NBC_00102 TaxID=2975652 RepID=UPI002251F149|nr:maleylpyruvate isomerase family mycothiol-dependent enzyme [Streptomyces sp. NBC_00102]MCX5401551.1 maleylpyruvate isomerase family mycothiol-dependent enzyme [Streptomyces sp. NBC_00102]